MWLRRTKILAPRLRIRVSFCAHLITWHISCQEVKLLIRVCSHEVFFFSFCPFRQVDYFKPKLPDLWEQHNFVPTSTSHSLRPLRFLLPSSSHPQAVLLDSQQEAIRQHSNGPRDPNQEGLPPCGQASVPFVEMFSANTRTEREARINSQTYKAKRQRDSNLGASHRKDGVRVGECPRWQGP